MRTAVLMDTESVYRELLARYNRRLDYSKFLTYLKETFNYDVQIKYAYGNQNPGNIKGFTSVLRDLGFQLRFKQRKTWEVEVSLHAASIANKIDCLVLCTSNPNYQALIPWIEHHGVKVHIICCNVPKELFEHALATEITTELCFEVDLLTEAINLGSI